MFRATDHQPSPYPKGMQGQGIGFRAAARENQPPHIPPQQGGDPFTRLFQQRSRRAPHPVHGGRITGSIERREHRFPRFGAR